MAASGLATWPMRWRVCTYETARTSLAERGRDFCSSVYVADVSPHTGAVLYDHEDYVHKLKNLVSQLRSQPDTPVDAADNLLLSKARILAAASKDPSLAHIAGALANSVDAQNVPICEALVYDEGLQAQLIATGGRSCLDALVLRVLGHAHQAWDFPHLTSAVRTRRLQNLRVLLRALLLPDFDDVFKMASFASRTIKRYGFTSELLFVLMANVEAREQLLCAMPGASLALVERSFSTDDLENEFSWIVNGCGFKPPVETVMGFLEHLDFLYMLRRRPDAGIVLPKSSKVHYTYHDAMQLKDVSWNDGLFLRTDEESRTALVRHIAAVTSRACNVLGLKRDLAVRDFHAMRH
jgi:hypothetical protein